MGFNSGIGSCGQNLCCSCGSSDKRGKSACRLGSAGPALVLSVCVLLQIKLWHGYCLSWCSFCLWVLEECLDLQLCDTAEKLFVARLHFHKHFDPPLPSPKI